MNLGKALETAIDRGATEPPRRIEGADRHAVEYRFKRAHGCRRGVDG
jgi:hypothetical protein